MSTHFVLKYKNVFTILEIIRVTAQTIHIT